MHRSGRSASHIALECALQTRPNATLISEEVEVSRRKISDQRLHLSTWIRNGRTPFSHYLPGGTPLSVPSDAFARQNDPGASQARCEHVINLIMLCIYHLLVSLSIFRQANITA